ncbi:hypothetical protein [Corynebacterium marquesiae]|uniref:hypothetical protein n=1 Tax=Corynebacterium marquesiae TaxID=2913503 RepID=UPI0032F072B7
MPTVKGNLLFVSSRVAQVSEVWVRAPKVRTHAEGLVTTGNDHFPVIDGQVEFTAVPGPAVLALISQGRAVDTVPIVVGDAETQTLRQVVNAAEIADDATKREIEKLAAQAIHLVDSSTENARKAQDGAQRAETAAGEAESSAASAATSEQNVAKSASDAAGSATIAKQDADRAANIANSTSWDGDRLTVNGKTSPSLTGPKGEDGAKTWDEVQDKPAAFPPESHKHTMSEISDLPKISSWGNRNTIPVRDANGRFFVSDPEKSGQAANKSYVDTAVESERIRTIGMVWMVETEDQAQKKESSCQKGDFIQVAQTGNIYQVV